MTTISHWPAVLRAAGIPVVVHPAVSRLSNGTLRDHNIVWHHDASPVGDSPGALSWMLQNYHNSSAQVWVDRRGTWYIISYGVAWHAGRVNDAKFDNYHSVGIETDHTTGEAWPTAQIDSLRRGTAAILKHEGKTTASLGFHKTICVPPGRKSDPDGLSLASERQTVAALMSGSLAASLTPAVPVEPSPPAAPITGDDDLILISAPNRGQALIGANYYYHLPTPEYAHAAMRVATKVVEGNDREFDLWASMAVFGSGHDTDELSAKVDALIAKASPQGE